jgi:thymidylate synthase (FAD)
MEVKVYNDTDPWKQLAIAGVSHGIVNSDTERLQRLLKRLIILNETSPLEHIVFTFHIKDITRGCLQELVRHRMASYTVLSTRYTLKQRLKDITPQNIDKFFYTPTLASLEVAQRFVDYVKGHPDLSNDELKLIIPENMYTELYLTINLRSLLNFWALRSSPKAHREIRKLSDSMFDALLEMHPKFFEIVSNAREGKI